ncbi:MAG: hypothetical protein R6W31_09565 [Bacteroidales bacterium]
MAMITVAGKQLNAQTIELTPFLGYETGASISIATLEGYTDLRIADGMNYGGALNAGMGGGRYAEFSYNHMGSELSRDGVSGNEYICDLAVDYYSFGMLQELKPEAKATPFGMVALGWVNYRPTTGDYVSENKMHVSLAGGLKIRASERVGIRLQARLLMPLYYSGAYFGVGTGGSGFSVGGGIHGVQGDFTGGLVLFLKK